MSQSSKSRRFHCSKGSAEFTSLLTELSDASRSLLTEIQLTCEFFLGENSYKAEQDYLNELGNLLSSALLVNQKITADKRSVQSMNEAAGCLERMQELMDTYPTVLAQSEDPTRTKEYARFIEVCQQLQRQTSASSEVSATVRLIDPITKKPIVNPVRNIHCGHVYEKEAIVSLLQMSKQPLKCVCLGCPNKRALRLEDLKPLSS
uniref:E3 SUMO-protein ligase NSE2 n=1 Tax=Trichuris muris TaxID=70415 RepID=A0A5S6QI03_TRIMR